MVLNILMLIAMYPMMMIVCYMMYVSMKPKNGLAFGCTISAVRMKDETLKEIERQWAAEMKRNIIITALLPFAAFFIPYVSIQITIWTVWVFVLIVLLEWPFIKANAKVKELKRDILADSDDDHYWIWGLIYNNPKDKHTMVSQRVGMGTTINLATKAGKIWWAVTVIVMLSVPILCGWVILEEFTPISLSINEDEVHANHLKLEHELPIEKIEHLELVEDLPSFTKAVGSSMETLAKGSFRIKGTGEKCILFLNPQNEKFLRFEVDGQVYYMSGLNDEETMKVYERLEQN